jgi:methylthioribulose-1-phosphate dehydratase
MTKHYPEVLRQLGEVKTLFAFRGWMSATSGNFSQKVRENPLEFFISVSGRDKSGTLPDDFILVDERGEPLNRERGGGNERLKPSAEVGVHAEIYKRLSAGVVLHVHTLYNTYISIHSPDPERLTIQGLEMIKGLGIWGEENRVDIPIVPNHHDLAQLSSEAGKSILPSTPGILIRGHGLYAWGKNLYEAKRNVEAFEFLFQYLALEYRSIR